MSLREYLQVHGPERCSDVELLALAVGADRPNSSGIRVAQALWDRFGGIQRLAAAEVSELAECAGLGKAGASRLKAALGLALRLPPDGPSAVHQPADAATWLGPGLRLLEDEALHGLFLDRRYRVVAHRRLTCGGPDHTLVDPRQILRVALRLGAHAVILAHNHPSGDPEPSSQDREVTRRLARAAREVGVSVLDHLVFGRDSYVSLAERGELSAWGPGPVAAVVREPSYWSEVVAS